MVDGAKIAYSCSGADTNGRPTVILLAGMPDPLSTFTDLQKQLSSTTRVCSYDRQGEGASPAPTSTVTLQDEATILAGLLKALGITRKVVVAGHSLGGLVAAQFAGQYPQLTAGCVLIDATPPSVVKGVLSLIPASAKGIPAEVRGEMVAVTTGQNPERLVYDGTPTPRIVSGPLLVIPHTAKMFAAMDKTYGPALDTLWAKGQQAWLKYGTAARIVKAKPNVTHYVYRDDSQVVVTAIRSLVGSA